ncbi:MAG: hypothetical protein ACNI26_15690 [Terasakiella sp.]|uniref:hypothetical protein n=1 Tax=unclassified Terasakiella TaxID=2614952 RepID=UPI003AFFD086
MTKLKSLNFVEPQAPAKSSPFENARRNLITNLNRQLAAANAMVKGETYTETRMEYVEGENGQRVKQEIQKPIRKWYWRDYDGKVRFSLRIRNKAIEIENNKTDILIGEDKQLPRSC